MNQTPRKVHPGQLHIVPQRARLTEAELIQILQGQRVHRRLASEQMADALEGTRIEQRPVAVIVPVLGAAAVMRVVVVHQHIIGRKKIPAMRPQARGQRDLLPVKI